MDKEPQQQTPQPTNNYSMENETSQLRLEIAEMKWEKETDKKIESTRKEAYAQGYKKGKGESDTAQATLHTQLQDLNAQVAVLQKEKERLEKLLA